MRHRRRSSRGRTELAGAAARGGDADADADALALAAAIAASELNDGLLWPIADTGAEREASGGSTDASAPTGHGLGDNTRQSDAAAEAPVPTGAGPGGTIRPKRDNPAAQRRARQHKGAHDAPAASNSDKREPRFGPPNARVDPSAEHPSWRLVELPPAAEWAPTAFDGRAASPILVLFRQEMRLADHPALHAAAATGRPVVPAFILPAPSEQGGWPLAGAAKLWLHHALNNLQHSLKAAYGSALVLRDGGGGGGGGGGLAALVALAEDVGAGSVYWNMCYEPWVREADDAAASVLSGMGMQVRTFHKVGTWRGGRRRLRARRPAPLIVHTSNQMGSGSTPRPPS